MTRQLLLSLAALQAVVFTAHADVFNERWRTFKVGPNPNDIAATDLNDDTFPEIVTVDRGTLSDPREERPANDEVSLLIAQEPLTYVKHHPSLKTGFGPYAVALANIDALKWPDIIVVSFHSEQRRNVSLFLNLKQEGIFQAFEFDVEDLSLEYLRQLDGDDNPIFTTPGLTSVAVHDFDGDGFRDLISTAWSSDQIVLMRGNAESHFAKPTFIAAPGAPRELRLGDLDKDGATDATVAMYGTNEIAVFRGDGNGGFKESTRFPSRGRLPVSLAVADVNGDGNLDISVAHCYSDDSIVIFYGDGNLGYSISQEILLGDDRQLLEHEIRDIVAGDFNNDGRTDLAAACFGSGEVVALVNVSGGNGKNQDFRREKYSIDGGKPRALCTADFDQNGSLDLGVALWDLDMVGLLLSGK